MRELIEFKLRSLKRLVLATLLWCSALLMFAQETRMVSGTVTDETGLGTPGVNVFIQGTTTGTVTNLNGQYTIEITDGDVLEFRYIGYNNYVVTVIAATDIYNVQLEPDNKRLDEVVVVGYGIQKKSDLSSAVSTIKAKDANKIAAASAGQMMQGRSAGVSVISGGSPGSNPYVKIRGMSSFGSVQPLYVIDGIPGGDLRLVNPDDITSFEILKDGAAAAIYGSQAANGVILITTKSGKKNQPAKVDFSMYAGIQETTDDLPMANASEWYSIMDQAYGNSVKDGSLTQEQLPAYLQPSSGFDLKNYADTDWQKETLQTGVVQNYSLGISGGGESSSYNLSTNYYKQEGVVINTGTERYNFLFKASFEKGNLTVKPQVMYVHTNTDNNTMSMGNMQRSNPLAPVYDNTKESGYGYINEFGFRTGANPVGQSVLISNITKRDQLQTNLGLNYQFTDELFAVANVGYSKNFFSNRMHHPAYVLASDTRQDKPKLRERRLVSSDINYDFTLNYMKSFDKHAITAMAGIVGNKYESSIITAEVTGGAMFPDFGGLEPSFAGMKSGDFIGSGGYDTSFGGYDYGGGGFREITRFSYMGRLNYNYDNRYLVQATVRTDGSSKFGKDKRWGTFPSVSAAWKINNESFFADYADIFSELKLRASYGILGRETALGAYSRQALVAPDWYYVLNNKPVGDLTTFKLPNNALMWEESKTMNIGLDFGLYQHKVYGTVNYYQNDSEELLIKDPNTPMSSGLNSPTINLGTISNRGIEFELGYRGAIGDLKFDVTGNFTTIDNEVKELGDRDGRLPGDKVGGSAQTFSTIGKAASQFFMFKTDGIFQSAEEIAAYTKDGKLIQPNAKPGDVKYIDVDNSGTIGSEDVTDVGSPMPDFEYGLNIGMNYKNFDLSMFFQGVSGNKILNVTRYDLEAANRGFNVSNVLMNAWTPTNKNTNVPRNVNVDKNNNYRISDRFLEDGSYLRMKNIQLGYTLPKSLLTKLKVESLRIYINADNVFTITDYNGFDPEIRPTNALTQGVDFYSYPMYRTFTAGVQLTF